MTLVTLQLLMLVLCGGLTNPESDLLAFTYDGPLVTGVSWSAAAGTGHPNSSVSFGYDNHFRVTSIGVDSELPVLYSYDQDGYITNAAGLTVSRDGQNGLLTGTSITAGSQNVITSRSHNDFGEAISMNATYSGGDLGYAFSYDADGRIDSRQETSGASSKVQSYAYDLRGRLTDVYVDSVLTYEYDYDANGNRVAYTGPEGTVSATYDAQDRLLTYGTNSYTYNDHGQLTSKTDAGGTTSYNYDELGNLLSVTLPDSTLIEHVIDALGRRVAKKVNGTLVRQWVYQDALNPVAEYDGSGNLIQRFVYATRMNVPDFIIRGGTTYRVIADQVGSVRRIVEVSSGAVVHQMTYSPFGKVLGDSSPGWQPFAYAGGLYDVHTKLVRFGARDYDAEVGRWTAKDPIRFQGGTNLYVYAMADPVGHLDISGRITLNRTQAADFPNLDALLNNFESQVTDRMIWAATEVTGLTAEEVRAAIQRGGGPELTVDIDGSKTLARSDGRTAWGCYNPETGGLDLDPLTAQYVEGGQYDESTLRTIMHETIHWLNAQKNGPYSERSPRASGIPDLGEQWETLVWGDRVY